jgi:transcriptional regulator of arginine metabolism
MAGSAEPAPPAAPPAAPAAGAVVTSVSPGTKPARHAQIAAILGQPRPAVRSQEELAERLAHLGVQVTQATLSRDLEELGAVRLRGTDGGLVYALAGEPGGGEPSARLRRVAAELLLAAEASANLVVLRTPAGAAQFLASVIDQAAWSPVLGTVAGDDTVLIIARDPAGGADLARAFLDLAERRAHRDAGPAGGQTAESGTPLRRKS